MCTVSIVPVGVDGFRLMCNRDEQLSRAESVAPMLERTLQNDAIYPRDPVGRGTWVGVNTAGIAVALLNRYDDDRDGRRENLKLSRGCLAVDALQCSRLEDVAQYARQLDAAQFAPFRLMAVSRHRLVVIASDGEAVDITRREFAAPVMFTSSSLGDMCVGPVRRALFEQLIGERPELWLARQSRFHRHQWTEHPEISVLMARPDAATVSRSTIDVSARTVHFRYERLGAAAQAA
jgi:uncharacterized protein with NRDE domain